MTEGSGSGIRLEKFKDPDPNPVCPELLDPDPVNVNLIRNPVHIYL